MPTTYSFQTPSGGIKAHQVNPSSGQTTTSNSYEDMSSGTQSITLGRRSIVKVTAHANAYATSNDWAYTRVTYDSGGADTVIGTQGYTHVQSDGQSITAGGVVTLDAGTYTIAMQKKRLSAGTSTYHDPGMSIVIIPAP
jgi:hypothetical protein